MTKLVVFKNIAVICGILLIIGLFVTFNEPNKKNLFELIYHTIGLTTFTFAYLSYKKGIILIGLMLYLVSYNIKLLMNPILPISDINVLPSHLNLIGLGIQSISFVCLLIGLSSVFEIKFLSTRFLIDWKPTILIVLLFTTLIQIVARFI